MRGTLVFLQSSVDGGRGPYYICVYMSEQSLFSLQHKAGKERDVCKNALGTPFVLAFHHLNSWSRPVCSVFWDNTQSVLLLLFDISEASTRKTTYNIRKSTP